MRKKLIILVLAAFVIDTTYAADITQKDTHITVSGDAGPGDEIRISVFDKDGDPVWLDSQITDDLNRYSFEFNTEFSDNCLEYELYINGEDKTVITVPGTDDITLRIKNADGTELSALFADYGDRYGIDAEAYNTLADKKKAAEIFRKAEPSDASGIKTAFMCAVAIQKINEGGRTEAVEALRDNAPYLGIDYDNEIEKLDQRTYEKFFTELIKHDYSSYDDFRKGYFDALALAKSNASSFSGGGGGGGGSGSGKSRDKGGVAIIGDSTAADDRSENDRPSENEVSPFWDIEQVQWAKENILNLYAKGIIVGKGDGRFDPLGEVTREEFVSMLVRMFRLSGGEDMYFDDVEQDAWYGTAVYSAAANGIVRGISENEFGVGMNITRQDCAVICARLIKERKGEASGAGSARQYDDEEDISDYALEAVREMRAYGIMTGTGEDTFSPDMFLDRAMAARIIDLLGAFVI